MSRKSKYTTPEMKRRAAAERQRRWRLANPERAKEVDARYHSRNPLAHRYSYLRRTYGLTGEAFHALLAGQGDQCAICGVKEPTGHNWCVDHDHATGKVRGILCHSCNTSIGHLRENIALFESAIQYLRRHSDS